MSWDNNNVACILVFPPWQKRGLGQLLMGVSYELSRREGRLGGPEKREKCYPIKMSCTPIWPRNSPIESRKKGLSGILVRLDLSDHLVKSFKSILDCWPDRPANLDSSRGCGHDPERNGHDHAEQIARWISDVGQGQDRNLGSGTRDGGGDASHRQDRFHTEFPWSKTRAPSQEMRLLMHVSEEREDAFRIPHHLRIYGWCVSISRLMTSVRFLFGELHRLDRSSNRCWLQVICASRRMQYLCRRRVEPPFTVGGCSHEDLLAMHDIDRTIFEFDVSRSKSTMA